METMLMVIAFWVHGFLFSDTITSHKTQPEPTAQVQNIDTVKAQADLKEFAKNVCDEDIKTKAEACDYFNSVH